MRGPCRPTDRVRRGQAGPPPPATYTGAPSQFRRMASATLTRPRPGQPEAPARRRRSRAVARARPRRAHHRHDGRLLRPPDVSPTTTATTRCSGAARCCTATLPSFDAYRAPTEHPLAIAFGALLVARRRRRRPHHGRRDVRVVRRSSPRACTASRAASFTPLVGLVAAALLLHALRLPVPRRARVHRHPVPRAGRLGGRARGRAPAPRHAASSCCSPRPGCCARRRGC